MKITLVCILLFMLFCDSQQFGAKMGPYDIVITRASNCAPEEPGTFNFVIRTHFVKENGKKTQLFGSDFSSPFSREEFEAMTLHNDIYLRKNNDYLLMYKYDGDACKDTEEYGKDATISFMKKIGLDVEEFQCYIPPGNYTIDDWNYPAMLPMPMLEYGEYKIIGKVFLGTRAISCVEIYGDVIPKALI